MRLNHPEREYENPAHLVSSVKVYAHRRNKVCRVLVHSFGVVQALIDPSRTTTEIAGSVEFFQLSSERFDSTKPSLTTSLQGKQGVQGARAYQPNNSAREVTFLSHVAQ